MSPIGDCSEGPYGSIGDWDVSGVTKMGEMFSDASDFNQGLSKWDVSAVTGMWYMFYGASAFKRELCGVAWVNSKADISDMFIDSPGSISSTVCSAARPGMVMMVKVKVRMRIIRTLVVVCVADKGHDLQFV